MVRCLCGSCYFIYCYGAKMINIALSSPINRTAALVTQKSPEYVSLKRIQNTESRNPLPMRVMTPLELNNPSVPTVIGLSIGRLTVIGKYKDGKGYVCRCSCGTYCIRQSKAILNKNNVQDRCEECRHLAYLKRDEVKRRTGKDVDIRNF